MIKKSKLLFLTTILTACHNDEGNSQGTYSKNFIKNKEKRYRDKQNYFYQKFSKGNIARIGVQGFYNILVELKNTCEISDFKNLIADEDLARAIIDGFFLLYNPNELEWNILGMVDNDQAMFIHAMLYNAETIIEQQIMNLNLIVDEVVIKNKIAQLNKSLKEKQDYLDWLRDTDSRQVRELQTKIDTINEIIKKLESARAVVKNDSGSLKDEIAKRNTLTSLLSRLDFVLTNKGTETTLNEIEEIRIFRDRIGRIFFERMNINGEDLHEDQSLTRASNIIIKKIINIIEFFSQRYEIYCKLNIQENGKQLSFDDFEPRFKDVLLNYLVNALVLKSYIYKEEDFANSGLISPSFLTQLLRELTQYNSKRGVERFQTFEIADQNEREFVFQIIFLALLGTSETLNGDFNPDIYKHLNLDAVDIQDAFAIRALLFYFFTEFQQTNSILPKEILDQLFRGHQYHLDKKYLQNSTKDKSIQEQASSINKLEKDYKIQSKQRKQKKIKHWELLLGNFTDQQNPNKQQMVQKFDKYLCKVVYGYLNDDKNVVCNNPNSKFVVPESSWGMLMHNFQQNRVLVNFFSVIPCTLSFDTVFINYSDDLKVKYFSSMMTSEDSPIKQIIYFILNTLQQGISIKECQDVKRFLSETISLSREKYNHLDTVSDYFNLPFKNFDIKSIEIRDDTPRIPINRDNIEKIIQLISINRSKEMTIAEVMLERMLNVFLLQACSVLLKQTL